jgi:hypothetical protein
VQNLKASFVRPSHYIFLLCLQFFNSAFAQSKNAQFQDLAIVLPPYQDKSLSIEMFGSGFWNANWSKTIEAGFEKSSVGKALSNENEPQDWRLVAIRVVPCQPFGTVVKNTDLSVFCWPELRLVWQPVLFGLNIFGRNTNQFADDRAFHAIYQPEASAMGASSKAIFDKIQRASKGELIQIQPSELATFQKMQRELAQKLMSSVFELRAANVSEQRLALRLEREEAVDSGNQALYFSKLRLFLGKWAMTSSLKAITAFSLPEGRDAPTLDEWVFLSFDGDTQGNLKLAPMQVHSPLDGRLILDLPNPIIGSQLREDPSLYDWAAARKTNPIDVAELAGLTLMWDQNANVIKKKISDRSQLLVPNTTCASCHRINDTKFNFHNLSYFEDQSVNISTRVINDVALDQKWLKENLK